MSKVISLVCALGLIFGTMGEEPVTTATTVISVEKIGASVKEEQLLNDQSFVFAKTISRKEIELLALLVMAEAEGEPERGQRLVIDTVLNRVDSGYFPDNIHDVIYQPYQYSAMHGARVRRCEVREEFHRPVSYC
jgi:N-acetylmuramoyl-L-alanine amidase